MNWEDIRLNIILIIECCAIGSELYQGISIKSLILCTICCFVLISMVVSIVDGYL